MLLRVTFVAALVSSVSAVQLVSAELYTYYDPSGNPIYTSTFGVTTSVSGSVDTSISTSDQITASVEISTSDSITTTDITTTTTTTSTSTSTTSTSMSTTSPISQITTVGTTTSPTSVSIATTQVEITTSTTTTSADPVTATDGTVIDYFDDAMVQGQDTTTPADLLVDEQVLYLTYMANYDQNICLAKAQEYAALSTSAVRRRWAEKIAARRRRRRRRSLIGDVCLGWALNIPTTIHWVVPAAVAKDPVKLAAWTDNNVLNSYLTDNRRVLNRILTTLSVKSRKIWTDANANKVSSSISPLQRDSVGLLNWVKNTKLKTASGAPYMLNIFLVDHIPSSDSTAKGNSVIGYSSFPGKDIHVGQSDAVFIDRNYISNGGRDRVSLAHEIGHWLGLFHVFEGGCTTGTGPYDGDRCSDTPQFKTAGEYSYDCNNVDMHGGVDETNIMSYSDLGVDKLRASYSIMQQHRAVVGYTLYRRGLQGGKEGSDIVESFCQGSSLRRSIDESVDDDDDDLDFDDSAEMDLSVPLSKRLMAAELSRFCQRTDLVVEDHEFTELSQKGLYNTDSPALSDQPTPQVLDGAIDVGEPIDASDSTDQDQSGFADMVKAVQAQYQASGKVFTNATLTEALGTATATVSTATSSSTSGSISGSGSGSGSSSSGSMATPFGAFGLLLVIAAVSSACLL